MSNHQGQAAYRVESSSTVRAALYMRVSTGRQAEHDLSIPDQRKQLRSWCRTNGHDVVAEFVEGGASAGDDRRPAFQQMIERACDGDHAFDLIVVHSYSRFFREAFEQEFYLRKLAKHGVRVISITQPVGDETEPVQAMMRKVIALFDEYQSKENAKHVLRTMKENAQQGFWNGAIPPLGYKVVEAERRGTKIKKKLDIDPVEAETARLIFRLYLHGDGKSGALGVKEIVKWLNARGYRTRTGQTFGVGGLHKLLTNTIYIGRWRFNQRSSKTGKRKPDDEVVEISVPPIIEPHVFEQVQRQLHARSPKVTAPRVTTGPILLTGLAVCASCRGGMMLRTGTSKNGQVYRYYTCSNCVTKGKTVCKGRSIAMDKLDGLVTGNLIERLFQPERLAVLLDSLSSRRAEKAAAFNDRLMALQREVTESDEKLKRLYCLVEDGLTNLDEVLKDRLNALKADRERAKAALERAKEHVGTPIHIEPELIERFGRTMRENFSDGSVPFRKAYLQSLIDVIEVDDQQVRIKGSKDLLEKAVLASQSGQPGCSQMSTRWRARRDSNS
ncbi:MAG TPA: recombinase family protein [Xanthobacteraceae bacterium]|nr:recombinase family protein [Xanthobacteraceae bacterium]